MLGLTLTKYGYVAFIVWVIISIIVGVIVWRYSRFKSSNKGLIVSLIMLVVGYFVAYIES